MSDGLENKAYPPTDEEECMPDFMARDSTGRSRLIVDDRDWASYLFPTMAWLVFFFNLAVGLAFVIDLFQGHYDYAKHLTTVTTMCASYIALTWAYHYIQRDDRNGRFG